MRPFGTRLKAQGGATQGALDDVLEPILLGPLIKYTGAQRQASILAMLFLTASPRAWGGGKKDGYLTASGPKDSRKSKGELSDNVSLG